MVGGFVCCIVNFDEKKCLWIYFFFGLGLFVFGICFWIERYEVYVEGIEDYGYK